MATPLMLRLEEPGPALAVWFRRPDGTRASLPMLRLTARANFKRCLTPSPSAGLYGITTAIVDTGAYYTVIAERLWRRFIPGFITPLPFDPQTPSRTRVTTIAGGAFPYTLGELTIPLQDFDRTILPITIVAKLIHDGGRLTVPLTLVLRGGFLDGRIVHAEPEPAAAFGQAWSLADP